MSHPKLLEGVEGILESTRYALRSLSRAPVFALTVVATLALAIGATTAMFSVVNGVLLDPLPYPDPHRLVELTHEAPGLGVDRLYASPAIYFAYRDHNETFDSVGYWDSSPVTVTGAGEPESLRSLQVTHEILPLLGAELALGRAFTAADDTPGAAPTVIVSHGYWQRRFGGGDMLGRTIAIDGVAREIVGVLAQDFQFFDAAPEIYYPVQPDRSTAVFPSFDGRAIARLRAGVSLEDANADVARMIPILSAEFPSSGFSFENAQFGPRLQFLKDSVVGNLGATLWLLMGMIATLLLIACANVANLVLVRTEGRGQELAIRAAMGAGWGGIARVVAVESAVLAIAGGMAGVGIAAASLPAVISLGAADLPHVMGISIDAAVASFALAVSMLAAVLIGLIPLARFTGPRLLRVLRGAGRSVTDGREGKHVSQVLVVAQVGLAFLLLAGSGLMIRTFQNLLLVDPGFRAGDEVQAFHVVIPATDASDAEQAIRMHEAIAQRVAAVPGVDSAAFASFSDPLPLDGDGRSVGLLVEGRPPVGGIAPQREVQFVAPGFFETLGTRLVTGRTFDWDDVYGGRSVAVISESLALEEWGSVAAAIGQRLGTSGPWFEVVGIIQDVHHEGLSRAAPPVVAFPVPIATPRDVRTATHVVRSARVGTPGFLREIEQAIASVNRNLAAANPRTIGDLHEDSMARTSLTLSLLAIAGSIALPLGLIGIYGVVSQAVARRRREIGIRLALGARPAALERVFVAYALSLAGLGVAVGIGAALGLARLMSSQLFEVSPLDPLTYAAVAALVVAAALLASFIPARRAAATDPADVMKAE